MKPKYKRILLKLSGEALAPQGQAHGISMDAASDIVCEIKSVVKEGIEVAIVIGGGNIFRGAHAASEGQINQAKGDMMGMLATVINGLALEEALGSAGLKACVMSSIAMPSVTEGFVRKMALEKLSEGYVLVLVGGTGRPFFSTDTAASLKALEVGAEVILKGTKVDGVYSADPMRDSKALKFEKLSYLDVLKSRLKVMDLTAISMCMDHKLPIVVFNMFVKGNFRKAAVGEDIGTVVYG